MTQERLNRYLARQGVASRRSADALITAGRVRVNGDVAAVGTTIDAQTDVVSVDDKDVAVVHTPITIMLNKPIGVVSTRRDPQHRRTVMELAPYHPGLVPVGRLDTDSRGLLLLSTDGELTHRLTHPRYGVTKTYHITITPAPTLQQMLRLRSGVQLDDGPARPLEVNLVDHATAAVLEMVMGEGRKREVRRICAAVGLEVRDLRRVGFGPLRLVGVAEGGSRPLSRDELIALYGSVELPVMGSTAQTRPV